MSTLSRTKLALFSISINLPLLFPVIVEDIMVKETPCETSIHVGLTLQDMVTFSRIKSDVTLYSSVMCWSLLIIVVAVGVVAVGVVVVGIVVVVVGVLVVGLVDVGAVVVVEAVVVVVLVEVVIVFIGLQKSGPYV